MPPGDPQGSRQKGVFIQFLEGPVRPALPLRSQFQSEQSLVHLGELRCSPRGRECHYPSMKQYAHSPPTPGGCSLNSNLRAILSSVALIKEHKIPETKLTDAPYSDLTAFASVSAYLSLFRNHHGSSLASNIYSKCASVTQARYWLLPIWHLTQILCDSWVIIHTKSSSGSTWQGLPSCGFLPRLLLAWAN